MIHRQYQSPEVIKSIAISIINSIVHLYIIYGWTNEQSSQNRFDPLLVIVSLIFTSECLIKYNTKTVHISLWRKWVSKLIMKLKVKVNQSQKINRDFNTVRCIFDQYKCGHPNFNWLWMIMWTSSKFWFQIKFDLEGLGQSTPKTTPILTNVFCTSGLNLVILISKCLDLSCRQAHD